MKRKTLWIIGAVIMTLAFLSAVLTLIYSDRSKAYKIAESILGVAYLSFAVCWWIKAFTLNEYDEEDNDDEDESEED